MIEPKLTADGLWKILEPKVTEYSRIGRIVFWVGTGLISIFVSAIIAIFAIPGVKPAVLKVIIDVDAQAAHYLDTKEGKEILESDVDNYLRNEKGQGFKIRFTNLLEEQLSQIVAYSYSVILPFNEIQKIYNLPFRKPDKSEGKVECDATYPNAVKNAIYFRLNDREDYAGTIKPQSDSHSTPAKILLSKNNADLFSENSSSLDPKKSLNQKLIIQVDDSKPFKGTIVLTCSVTIIGSARLPQQ